MPTPSNTTKKKCHMPTTLNAFQSANPEMHIAQRLNMKKSQRVDASALFRVSKTVAICIHFNSEAAFVKVQASLCIKIHCMFVNMGRF